MSNPLKNSFSLLFPALAVGALLAGCAAHPSHTLGAPVVVTNIATTVQALSSAPAQKPVVVEGEMIEKCPVAGCWFMLKDKTGVVRVDTKSAGFVVTEVPLHSRLTVSGTVTPGAQPGIAASGVSY